MTLWKLRALAVLAGCALLNTGCWVSAPPASDVVARVNGKDITAAELERQFQKRAGADLPAVPEEAQDMKLQLLGQIVNDEILLSMAVKRQVTVSDAEVEAKFIAYKGQFSEDAFAAQLKQQKTTAEGMKADMRRALTLDKLVNKEVTSKIKVSDDEIRDFYNRNKARFNLPEGFRIAHILVTKFEDAEMQNAKRDDAKNPDQAKQKTVRLLNDIRGGADFAAVARDYSEDPTSAAQGGDIQFQTLEALGNIDPRIAQVVQKMKKGDIWSQAIETRFGFHIVKLLDKDQGGQRDLTDPRVQSLIHQEIFNRRDEALKAALLDVARNNAQVSNYLAERMLAAAGSKAN